MQNNIHFNLFNCNSILHILVKQQWVRNILMGLIKMLYQKFNVPFALWIFHQIFVKIFLKMN